MGMRRRVPWAVRLLAGFVFEVVSAAAVVGVPGWWLVRHADWGRLAAAQASAALGRTVTIGSLRVGLGQEVTVELRDAAIANLPGLGAPEMLTLRQLSAVLDRRALLSGQVVLERTEVDGLSMLLGKDADGVANWRFGGGKASGDSSHRRGFPSFRDVHGAGNQVTYRLRSGRELVTKLDRLGLTNSGDDQPVKLVIDGSYNGVPVGVDADLGSVVAMRDVAKPFPTKLHFTSGAVQLVFDGTMTNPLDFDGLDGTVTLDGDDPRALYQVAGLQGGPDVAVNLDGHAQRSGDHWRVEGMQGQLGTDEVKQAALDFEEGAQDKPDAVSLDAVFATLNLNDLLGSGARGRRGGADMSLAVSRAPKTLLRLRLAAGRVEYGELVGTDASVGLEQTAGRVAVDPFSVVVFGTRVTGHGAIEAMGDGSSGHLTAELSAGGADVQGVGRVLGFGALPLRGRMEVEALADAVGASLNLASRGARISAVAAMRGGSVEKQVVLKASANLRTLFGADSGWSAITCVIAGVDMQGGLGIVAPLRLRSADGTIVGSGRFDLSQRNFDLTVGSEARTTGVLALDVPLRIYGPFGSPTVRPAQWSAQGRAQLAAADSLSALPSALRDWARRAPCPP